MTFSSRGRSEGFVLVAVIWVLAALALVAGFIAVQVESLQNQSFAMEQRRVESMDRLAIESVLLYMASTRTATYAGLLTEPYVPGNSDIVTEHSFAARGNEIRLDGRMYPVRGNHRIRIQDAGSLVSLRNDQTTKLEGLLQSYQLPDHKVEYLISTLYDYTDRDHVSRLNGAERGEYSHAGMMPPTNRFLTNPWQLLNVIGWQEHLEKMPGFFEEITIYVGDRENYNTMTPKAMKGFGVNIMVDVERIFEHRSERAFGRLQEVLEVSGQIFDRDPMAVTFLPSRYLRLRIAGPGSNTERWVGVTLTPNSNLAPWEIDYRVAGVTMKSEQNYVRELAAPTALLR